MKKIARIIIDFYYHLINKILLKINKVEVKCDLRDIRGILFLRNKGRIEIAKGVRLNTRYSANPIGGQGVCTFVTSNTGEIIIGEGCAISNSTIVSNTRVNIGQNVFIGGDCKIYDTDFHSIYLQDRLKLKDNNIVTKEINILKGVFIGGGTIILKGVTIGSESVIGAGSVVTKDIPEKQIWAGNPAKFIRNI